MSARRRNEGVQRQQLLRWDEGGHRRQLPRRPPPPLRLQLLALQLLALQLLVRPAAGQAAVRGTVLYATVSFVEQGPGSICGSVRAQARVGTPPVVGAFLADVQPQVDAALTSLGASSATPSVAAYETCRVGPTVRSSSTSLDLTTYFLRLNLTYPGKASTRRKVRNWLNDFAAVGGGPCRAGGMSTLCRALSDARDVPSVNVTSAAAAAPAAAADLLNVTASFTLSPFGPETCLLSTRPAPPPLTMAPWDCGNVSTFYVSDFCSVDCAEPRATGAGYVIECTEGNVWEFTGGCTATPRCSSLPSPVPGIGNWSASCAGALQGSLCRTSCSDDPKSLIAAQCIAANTWSPPTGNCDGAGYDRCRMPPPLSPEVQQGAEGWRTALNGSCANAKEGQLCFAPCAAGWLGVGYSSLCLPLGNWGPAVGACVQARCLSAPSNARLADASNSSAVNWDQDACSNVTLGTVCRTGCKASDLSQGYAAACIDQNTWSAPFGGCTPDTCNSVPSAPASAPFAATVGEFSVSCAGSTVGAVCRAQCREGFRGWAKADCLRGGTWNVSASCTPKRCLGRPPQDAAPGGANWPEGCGSSSGSSPGAPFGRLCRVACDPDLVGPGYTAVCSDPYRANATGEWVVEGSCSVPVCAADPPDPPNGTFAGQCGPNVPVGDKCQAQCDDGYDGSPTAECVAPDTWAPLKGSCDPKT